jgi:hypothetical protein
MNVPSTSPPKGASRALLVYAGKNKVRYFLNTPRTYKKRANQQRTWKHWWNNTERNVNPKLDIQMSKKYKQGNRNNQQ